MPQEKDKTECPRRLTSSERSQLLPRQRRWTWLQSLLPCLNPFVEAKPVEEAPGRPPGSKNKVGGAKAGAKAKADAAPPAVPVSAAVPAPVEPEPEPEPEEPPPKHHGLLNKEHEGS